MFVPNKLCAKLILSFFLLSLLPSYSFAESSNLDVRTEDERLVQWVLSADSVKTLNEEEVLEARGNVVLRKGSEYLRADFARYYLSTKWVFLQGNVEVQMGKDTLSAEEAEFDLRSRVGWLKKGRIFMSDSHAYIAGDHINKYWGDVYSFQNAKVTTCDGDVPAWSITADEAVVEIDGYAHLTGSSFKVKDKSIISTPFFLFPTKVRRQTGLLTPEVGRNSQHGFFYNQPFFWAINDYSDMSFDAYGMEERGVMIGAEYRIRPSVDSMGWLRFDWLHDQVTVNTPSKRQSIEDNLLRKNTDRYWIRGMYDGLLPDPNWRFKADIDYVSDQEFLSDFRTNRPGFNRSQDTLFNLFSRDIQERTLNRQTAAMLSRDWERGYISLLAQYNQDPSLGHGNRPKSSDETVQRLPQFDAFLYKGRIIDNIPLEVDASGQASYMYRRSGTRGARYDAVPRLTLPLTSDYGSIIVQSAVHKTFYNTETAGKNQNINQRERKEHRTVPELNAEGFTELAKVYPLSAAPLDLTPENKGQSRWIALRHSVQPRISYNFIDNVNQERNPYYDERDRLAPRSELTYSLVNIITTKTERVEMQKDAEGNLVPTIVTGYFDLARLRLEQSYDYREASRNEAREQYSRKPFSDILADLEIGITDYLSIYTRSYWSPYLNELTRHQSGLRWYFSKNSYAGASLDLRRKIDEYTRQRDHDLKFLKLDGEVALYGPWSIGGSYNQDLRNTGNSEKNIRLAYTDQCFKIIGNVYVDNDQEEYKLQIVLTGLGD